MYEIILITAISIAVATTSVILLTLSKNITQFCYEFTELSSIKTERETLQPDIPDYLSTSA